jgi:hypothetical protein
MADRRRRVELVIFVGLQASGKSTFFRERFAATHAHVSKDLFRNNRDRNRRQSQLIEAALGKSVSVVVDNTNPTVEDRRSLICLGRRFEAEIVGYYFDSTVRQSIGRNRQRAGADRVPDVAVYGRPRSSSALLTGRGSTCSSACALTATPPSMSGRSFAVERQLRDGREPEARYNYPGGSGVRKVKYVR